MHPKLLQNTRLITIIIIGLLALYVYLSSKVLPQFSSVLLMVCFLAFYTWLMTMAQIHRKRMEFKYPKPINTDYLPKVTVVVACHNEEAVIESTIQNLLKLDYPHYDLMIIDDRSTDRTGEILTRLAGELDARYHYQIRKDGEQPGKSAVLNDALRLSDGDALCVFDADAYMEPDFLRRIVPFLADENVGAVQARKVITNADDNWLTMCQSNEYALDAQYQYGRESIYGAVELRGNGQIVKRVAVEEVGGWNEHSVTDDLDLSTRLHLTGWDIRFAHKVIVFEEGITTLKALLKQRKRWAKGNMTRYFENAVNILTSKKVAIRTLSDMLAYFFQIILPLWLVLDFVFLAYDMIDGDASRIRLLSSLLIAPAIIISYCIATAVAIVRFNSPTFTNAIKHTVITGFYMFLIWMPISFAMIIKILFEKKDKWEWERTSHHGHAITEDVLAKTAVAVNR